MGVHSRAFVIARRCIKVALFALAAAAIFWGLFWGAFYFAIYFPIRNEFNSEGKYFDEVQGQVWNDTGFVTLPVSVISIITGLVLIWAARRVRW